MAEKLRPGARFSKVPKSLSLNYDSLISLKLVFSYVVNEIKIKVTAKFRAFRRLRFEDTKSCLEVDV